jgi:hypothetical protein
MIRLSATDSPARCDSQPAHTEPISRGATSRPNGEPSATVTICSNACTTVLTTGMRGSFDFTAFLMLTSGRPNRYNAPHPSPATSPQMTMTSTRRPGDAALTPSRKLSLLMTCVTL